VLLPRVFAGGGRDEVRGTGSIDVVLCHLCACRGWEASERSLFSCDDDKSQNSVGEFRSAADGSQPSTGDVYDVTTVSDGCCSKFVKQGEERLPLLEWLGVVYFSTRKASDGRNTVNFRSILPRSAHEFCTALESRQVADLSRYASSLSALRGSVARMIDVCSGSGDGDVWAESIGYWRSEVCTSNDW
jgi:hypothetical protein